MTEDDIVDMAYQYMIPLTIGSFGQFLMNIGCGLLQAEGRSFLSSGVEIVSFILNMCLFDPLFLVCFKP